MASSSQEIPTLSSATFALRELTRLIDVLPTFQIPNNFCFRYLSLPLESN